MMNKEEIFNVQQTVASCCFDLGNWVGIIERMIPDGTNVGGLVKIGKDEAVAKLQSIAKQLGEIRAAFADACKRNGWEPSEKNFHAYLHGLRVMRFTNL